MSRSLAGRFAAVKGALAAPRGDPYAGADLDNATRLGAALLTLGLGLLVALTIVAPPTKQIGDAGWAIAGGIFALSLFGIRWLRRGRTVSFDRLYVASFAAVAAIALLEWLAGGRGSPFHQLYLLPAVYVGAIHPARRVLVFLVAVAAAAFAPLAYNGGGAVAAADALTQFLLIAGVTLLGSVLMSGVRLQRITLRSDTNFAQQLANLDSLTRLGNRRAFDDAVAREMERARRVREQLVLLLGDLDNFKQVNDNSGHANGDIVLRQAAGAIADTVRGGDGCFRWGGDEFAVLLPATEFEEGGRIADRLAKAVTRLCTRPDGLPMQVSWGVAEFEPEMTPAELIDRADMNLLSVKRRQTTGGDRESSSTP